MNKIPVVFYFYDQSRPLMNSLGLIYIFVLTLFMPYLNISNSEYVANFGWVTKFINDDEGIVNRGKLLIYRWGLLLLTCSIAFITDKVEIVLNLCGSLAVPFVSFSLPVN